MVINKTCESGWKFYQFCTWTHVGHVINRSSDIKSRSLSRWVTNLISLVPMVAPACDHVFTGLCEVTGEAPHGKSPLCNVWLPLVWWKWRCPHKTEWLRCNFIGVRSSTLYYLCVFTMSHRRSEWIYTLTLPKCRGARCSKQAQYLKVKWLQRNTNPQPLSSKTNIQSSG